VPVPLPPGYHARPPRWEDLDAVVALMAEADTEHIGEPDVDADDVRHDWDAEDFDMEQDAVLLTTGEETLAAYAFARDGHGSAIVRPGHFGRGLGTALLPFVESRIAAQGGDVVRQQVDGSNDTARALLTAHGYEPVQRYWRMRIDLAESPPPADWPDGVRPRMFVPGADDADAHALINAAFPEVPGFVARPLEAWQAATTGRLQFRPDLSWVAERDSRMVGMALCEAWEDRGYVDHLAAAPDQRGLGLGRALLHAAFEGFRAAGLGDAVLSVNAANETATRLYEAAGMSVAWRAERWERRLSAAPSSG
jgi:mycothiol synthase